MSSERQDGMVGLGLGVRARVGQARCVANYG